MAAYSNERVAVIVICVLYRMLTVMNRYLDFFLFQTFTGMAYSDAKSFDYEQHIVTIDGKDYIDGHCIKTGSEFVTSVLPITRKILERNNYKMEITSNQKYNQLLKV